MIRNADRIGDRGQRFEIRFRRRDNDKEIVVGWTDLHPEQMVAVAAKHPNCSAAWSVDRKKQPQEV